MTGTVKRGVVTLGIAALVCAGGAVAAPVSDSTTYTLDFCPVSGQKLGAMGSPVVKTIGGREVRFCCAGCPQKYQEQPTTYARKVDEAIVKEQKANYPLDTCVVSGETLAGMDGAVDYVHGNRLVRFCCNDCIQTFTSAPAKYLAILDEAVVEKQKPSYPLRNCPIKGEELDEAAVDMVIANRLVRLCCNDCVGQVKQNPTRILQKIDEAKTK